MTEPVVHDVKEWLEENEKFFAPPICNKLMFKDGQLKTFFVGGPNSRKDFHMEVHEEFFYQLKGDMHLIVDEQGKFRDITIKEGEVFLLPPGIPHSPQRLENTIGLVIEQERLPNEMDCLRYYVDGTDEILYEKWFHCASLEELGPLIKEYFESEQYKTGKPIPGTILENKPIKQDFERKLEDPFPLKDWIKEKEESLMEHLKLPLFKDNYESRVWVMTGFHRPPIDFPETFLYQICRPQTATSFTSITPAPHSRTEFYKLICNSLNRADAEGSAILSKKIGNNFDLKEHQCALIPPNELWFVDIEKGGKTLCVVMNDEFS